VIPQVRLAGAARGRAQDRPPPPRPPRAARSATRRRSSRGRGVHASARTATAPARWQLLKHFVSAAMDIDGLGEKQVSAVHGARLGPTAADFYRLRPSRSRSGGLRRDLSVKQAGRRDRGVQGQPFGRVLFALGIEEVGDVTGRNLAQQFRDRRAAGRRRERSSRRPGWGRRWPRSIHDQLADRAMRR
jgi:DNA ligase (NAD+)